MAPLLAFSHAQELSVTHSRSLFVIHSPTKYQSYPFFSPFFPFSGQLLLSDDFSLAWFPSPSKQFSHRTQRLVLKILGDSEGYSITSGEYLSTPERQIPTWIPIVTKCNSGQGDWKV